MLTNEEKQKVESQINELNARLILTSDPAIKAEIQDRIDNLENYLFLQLLDEMLELGKTLPST